MTTASKQRSLQSNRHFQTLDFRFAALCHAHITRIKKP